MLWYQRFFRRGLTEKQLDSELRFHIDQKVADLVAAGVAPEEARRRAQLEFGGLEQVKEECRDVGTTHFLETLIQDLRYGLRMLAKNPGFTAVAVITLTLGIGANTAVFSFVDTLYLRPLPVRDAGQLVDIFQTRNGGGYYTLSYPDYIFYRDNSQSFSDLAAQYPTAPLSLVASGGLESVNGSVVISSYFRALELKPFFGRFFLPEEDEVSDRNPLAVISYGLWKRRFASDPNIVGKIIQLNGTAFAIVGIAPEDFRGAIARSSGDGCMDPERHVPRGLSLLRRLPARLHDPVSSRASQARTYSPRCASGDECSRPPIGSCIPKG
jgi:hypothetical protein